MTTSPGMQNYIQHIERLTTEGACLIEFDCPLCKTKLKTPALAPGETCDTLTDCPHCSRMFLLITEADKARGLSLG